MGFYALGLRFMKQKQQKMGMGFEFEQHRLGLWDLSWDQKRKIYWEMGLGPPFQDHPMTPMTGFTGTAEENLSGKSETKGFV